MQIVLSSPADWYRLPLTAFVPGGIEVAPTLPACFPSFLRIQIRNFEMKVPESRENEVNVLPTPHTPSHAISLRVHEAEFINVTTMRHMNVKK